MKIFLSQPMRDRTDKEILQERETAIKMLKAKFGDDTEFIDSFKPIRADIKNAPVWFLGRSLQLLSEADICVYIGENIYPAARGCEIEEQVCSRYNIPYVRLWVKY